MNKVIPLYTRVISADRDIKGVVIEGGGDFLKSCYQCGSCSAICPWNLVIRFLAQFAARRLIHRAQLGLVDLKAIIYGSVLPVRPVLSNVLVVRKP
jgi:heterodisulfide reductase subunit C